MHRRSLVQGWLAVCGHRVGWYGIRWITFFFFARSAFHFRSSGHLVSTLRRAVLRFPFHCEYPSSAFYPGDHPCLGRLPCLSAGTDYCLWSVLLPCWWFFGLGGIEESRDSTRDAWPSLLFVLSPVTNRWHIRGRTAAPCPCVARCRWQFDGASNLLLRGVAEAGFVDHWTGLKRSVSVDVKLAPCQHVVHSREALVSHATPMETELAFGQEGGGIMLVRGNRRLG